MFIFWTSQILDFSFGIEFDSGTLAKCHLSIVKHDDMASLAKDHYYMIGDYCSINPGCYTAGEEARRREAEEGGAR